MAIIGMNRRRSNGEVPTKGRAPHTPTRNSGAEVQKARPTVPAGASIVCPACGGTNPPDAVFCGNSACHKALSDFKNVLEGLRDEAQWHHNE
jgi:hypothetical protein